MSTRVVAQSITSASPPIPRAAVQQHHAPDGAAVAAVGWLHREQDQHGGGERERDDGNGYAHDCPLDYADIRGAGDLGIAAAIALGIVMAAGASFAMWAGWL